MCPGLPATLSNEAQINRMQKHLQGGVVTDSNVFNLQALSNCWICEGWAEHIFRFTPGVSDSDSTVDPENSPVVLHLEVDRFKGDPMMPSEKNPNVYECIRMLPPGNHRYYFSVKGQVRTAKDQKTVTNDGLKQPKKEIITISKRFRVRKGEPGKWFSPDANAVSSKNPASLVQKTT